MFSRLKIFSKVLKDPDKKNIPKIVWECLHYGWIKKEIPVDYFRKFLYRTHIKNYKDYLSLKEYYHIIGASQMRFPEMASIINNKLSLALYCKSNQLPTPELISYNLRHSFVFNNSITSITSKEALVPYFLNILNTIPQKGLFLKLLDSQGGLGCFILNKEILNHQIDLYGDALLNNSYIHQEIIQQHEAVSKINPNSVNTLRIDTYIDSNRKAHILSVLMRFGIGNSITDNASTGGFYVSVNLETGKLQGVGRQDLVKGGRVFLQHPSSKVILEDYKMPFFQEACNLALKASNYLPTRIIGWDIAITENGPVIVEGNEGPSLHMTDVAYGGYCKHPLIQEILTEIKK